MKISDLLACLETARAEHGDLEVAYDLAVRGEDHQLEPTLSVKPRTRTTDHPGHPHRMVLAIDGMGRYLGNVAPSGD